MPTRTATIAYAVPPSRLGHDAEMYMDPNNSWPQEEFEVPIVDIRPDLEDGPSAAEQLDTRGYAIFKNTSKAMGTLAESDKWNAAYLEESVQMLKELLGASEVYVWNSVTRSSDPTVNTPYEAPNLLQKTAIKGLQFGTVHRGASVGAHIDQDAPNSERMCRNAAGEDVFSRSKRVQQLNLWRPVSGPVTTKPLVVCDSRTLSEECRSRHTGLFGTRLVVHHGDNQQWGYISQHMPNEPILLKIYDSDKSVAPFAAHTSCDLYGSDGEPRARESIEVRFVVVYDHK